MCFAVWCMIGKMNIDILNIKYPLEIATYRLITTSGEFVVLRGI